MTKYNKTTLKENIDILKDKLNSAIINNKNYNDIYKISTELDELIVLYYKRKIYA